MDISAQAVCFTCLRPTVCFTCGQTLGDKYAAFQQIEDETVLDTIDDEKEPMTMATVLDKIKLKRVCCRCRFMASFVQPEEEAERKCENSENQGKPKKPKNSPQPPPPAKPQPRAKGDKIGRHQQMSKPIVKENAVDNMIKAANAVMSGVGIPNASKIGSTTLMEWHAPLCGVYSTEYEFRKETVCERPARDRKQFSSSELDAAERSSNLAMQVLDIMHQVLENPNSEGQFYKQALVWIKHFDLKLQGIHIMRSYIPQFEDAIRRTKVPAEKGTHVRDVIILSLCACLHFYQNGCGELLSPIQLYDEWVKRKCNH